MGVRSTTTDQQTERSEGFPVTAQHPSSTKHHKLSKSQESRNSTSLTPPAVKILRPFFPHSAPKDWASPQLLQGLTAAYSSWQWEKGGTWSLVTCRVTRPWKEGELWRCHQPASLGPRNNLSTAFRRIGYDRYFAPMQKQVQSVGRVV